MTARERNRKILSKAFLVMGSVAAALFGVEAAFSPLAAQKETFERNKPHVNVGPVYEFGSPGAARSCCNEAIVDRRDAVLTKPAKDKRRKEKADTPARR